jgi:hypothetical protein
MNPLMLSLLKKYGVPVALFLFGLHLHAQVYEWAPFWEDGFLCNYSAIGEQTQAVTGRWLMIAGFLAWLGVRYGLFARLGRSDNE